MPGGAETSEVIPQASRLLAPCFLCHTAAVTRRLLIQPSYLSKQPTEYLPWAENFPFLGLTGLYYQCVRKSRLLFMRDGGGWGEWRPQGHGEFKEPEENLRHCSLPISSSLGPPQRYV